MSDGGSYEIKNIMTKPNAIRIINPKQPPNLYQTKCKENKLQLPNQPAFFVVYTGRQAAKLAGSNPRRTIPPCPQRQIPLQVMPKMMASN